MTPELPRSIKENPRLDQWIDLSEHGVARVFSAKVELGQGILTALTQIAAEELALPMEQVIVVAGDTRRCPDESYTAGSMSIEVGGTAVSMACAEAREAILEQAARMLNVDPKRLAAQGGIILLDGARSGLDYWRVAPQVKWRRAISGAAPLRRPEGARFIGKSVARLDLPARVAGGGFIHDLDLPGMLHGRVLRPPSYGARLQGLDEAAVRAMAGVVELWRSGDFVGVVCRTEYQAVKALEALRKSARWRENDLHPGVPNWTDYLKSLPSIDSASESGNRPESGAALRRHSATYSRPPIAHASMAPSCALARWDGDRVTVWSHTQGVFPLRKSLATVLGVPEEQVVVIHTPGAGVYGHNGADDVALDAALLARRVPSRPVRVQWTREDELAWSPFGSPMAVRMGGAVSAQGRLADWSIEIWSGPHGARPGIGGAVNLLGAAHLDPAIPLRPPTQPRGYIGGERNSQAPYDLPCRRSTVHNLPGLPFRTSSLRTLGGFANVFANESFMDEMADLAGVDPVKFRLDHLSDFRARQVIEAVAKMARWSPDAARGEGHASGMAFSRYKNTAAYVAVIAEVEALREIRVRKVWCAVDAGLVINPDGVINQIEGGITQAISWTLKEQVMFEGPRVKSRSWEEYPILRFGEVPEINVKLIDNPDSPVLGVGEAAHGPAAAAVANAVARALGVRVRDLPITRERIVASN